jgi:hypothetical protein
VAAFSSKDQPVLSNYIDMRRIKLALAVAFLLTTGAAWSGETDQFLTWGIELQDSAGPVNERLNEDLHTFLARMNERKRPPRTREELTVEFFSFVFPGMFSPRIRKWLESSPDVDRFPDTSVSYFQYQNMSIYRHHSFPYVLPMARTIRIGDVYLGIDKISHFFGFGRRYFLSYTRLRDAGVDHKEAVERVIRVGISQEQGFVGMLVDGIFSTGDLEANFQGFLFALDLASAEAPFFERVDGEWKILRAINILPYITPGFDESYNHSHYWALRRKNVLPLVKREYCEVFDSAIVQARFTRYDTYEPSLSARLTEEHFQSKRRNPRVRQSLEALCESCAESTEETTNAPHKKAVP